MDLAGRWAGSRPGTLIADHVTPVRARPAAQVRKTPVKVRLRRYRRTGEQHNSEQQVRGAYLVQPSLPTRPGGNQKQTRWVIGRRLQRRVHQMPMVFDDLEPVPWQTSTSCDSQHGEGRELQREVRVPTCHTDCLFLKLEVPSELQVPKPESLLPAPGCCCGDVDVDAPRAARGDADPLEVPPVTKSCTQVPDAKLASSTESASSGSRSAPSKARWRSNRTHGAALGQVIMSQIPLSQSTRRKLASR